MNLNGDLCSSIHQKDMTGAAERSSLPSVYGLFLSAEDSVTMSGGARYALEIWEQLRIAGRPLHVLCSSDAKELAQNYGYSNTVPCMRVVSSAQQASWLIRTVSAVVAATRELIGAADLEIVYAESSFFQNVLPACVAKLVRRNLTFVAPVFHLIPAPSRRPGSRVRNAAAWIEQRAMVLLLAVFADVVVIDNPSLIDALASFGLTERRLHMTHMGVVKPSDDEVNQHLERRFDAVFCGRLSAAKGVGTLLDAWRTVVDKMPRAQLVLVGPGQPGFDLKAEITNRALENNVVHLAGLNDRGVRSTYLSSKIFVTASLEEGYGLSILEAFACGLPAVTFDLPAFAHAFPKGRIVSAEKSAQALAESIVAVLSDDSLYDRLKSEVARSSIGRTWAQVTQDLMTQVASAQRGSREVR